ncbi:MAG: hypothetical protein R3F14_29560 [Polyangiaceae bacterium]
MSMRAGGGTLEPSSIAAGMIEVPRREPDEGGTVSRLCESGGSEASSESPPCAGTTS